MNEQDFLYKLKTEVPFLVDAIVFNNHEAVAQKMAKQFQIQNSNPELIADEIIKLLNQGYTKEVEDFLTVPYIVERANEVAKNSFDTLSNKFYGNTEARINNYSAGLYQLVKLEQAAPTQNAREMSDTTQVLSTPVGEFSVKPESKTKSKTIYYVIGGAIVLGILFYYFKTKK